MQQAKQLEQQKFGVKLQPRCSSKSQPFRRMFIQTPNLGLSGCANSLAEGVNKHFCGRQAAESG
jgi:hypothetical protein